MTQVRRKDVSEEIKTTVERIQWLQLLERIPIFSPPISIPTYHFENKDSQVPRQLHTTHEDFFNLPFTNLLFVIQHGVLHSAYVQQKRQVLQDMFGESHLVCVHKEFGQSMGPQTVAVLAQKFLYSLTNLSWYNSSRRFWGGTRGRIRGRGEGDLQKG